LPSISERLEHPIFLPLVEVRKVSLIPQIASGQPSRKSDLACTGIADGF